MENETITFISKALDAAIMRQTAIAHNVANIHAAGFQPLSVNFEEQLQGALTQETRQAATPFYTLGNDTSLDEQMAFSVTNATHFRALVKGLNHQLAIMQLALQGNNT
jgi:flagellar basal-body rod protein FlgB